MAKNKTTKLDKIKPWLNQRTLMIIMFCVLAICVGVLITKQNSQKTELAEPTNIENPIKQNELEQ